ncbi:MAG: 2'-5' RNA ligase family protein [Nocardioidaceae bacterium]
MSTIGVAIAIPEPYAAELRQQRALFGDPEASRVPTHITLMPPSEVDGHVDEVEKHLREVCERHEPFRLRLRGTATFRPVSPVVFVNVTEGISSCELLAEDVRTGPLDQQLAFPYHPHVTVAHHLAEPDLDRAYEALADYDCAFDVDSFHLYEHGDDEVWRPRSSFHLRPDSEGDSTEEAGESHG